MLKKLSFKLFFITLIPIIFSGCLSAPKTDRENGLFYLDKDKTVYASFPVNADRQFYTEFFSNFAPSVPEKDLKQITSRINDVFISFDILNDKFVTNGVITGKFPKKILENKFSKTNFFKIKYVKTDFAEYKIFLLGEIEIFIPYSNVILFGDDVITFFENSQNKTELDSINNTEISLFLDDNSPSIHLVSENSSLINSFLDRNLRISSLKILMYKDLIEPDFYSIDVILGFSSNIFLKGAKALLSYSSEYKVEQFSQNELIIKDIKINKSSYKIDLLGGFNN